MKDRPDKKDTALHTGAILESISDGVFTVDANWRITSFNRAAEQITGVSREEAIGQRCSDVLRSNMCGEFCSLEQTLETGKPVIGKTGYIIDAEGNRKPISISTAVLKDNDGNVIGGAETFRDLSEIEDLRHELEGKIHAGEMTSRSPLMQKIFEVLPAIAASPSTVLVLGETGTGKELMARTLHDLSPVCDGPFVAVNCGSLPDTLLESELFGYKKGAFTGAVKDKPGRFALAEGGTIFLDEIGDVSPALQVRLLRVLQEKEYEPLGGTEPEKADVRVIVATHRNLFELVKEDRFREDLYYRINVIRIELPPLKNRKEDIPILVNRFIKRFNRLQKKNITGTDVKALGVLMAHDWPGNIRELENVVERAFILCSEGEIEISHLPPELSVQKAVPEAGSSVENIHDALDSQIIREAMARNNFNRLETARELGIHKTTLFRKIKRLGLSFDGKDGRSNRKTDE